MKRKIALLLTGIMTAAALAGCGGGDPTGKTDGNDKKAESEATESEEKEDKAESGDGVTLTLYCNADDLAKPYMQKIISLWE